MNRFLLKFPVLFLVLFTASLFAQIPSGYYDVAQGKSGESLKAALHNIIKNHHEFSYGDLWDILSATDEDPNNHNNVILIYTGISRAKSDHGGNSGQWNREHVWAKSHGGFGTTPPAGTDAHHIRPADVRVNGLRGNLDFDNGGSLVPGTTGCYSDNDSFEPRDAVKGDVARMIFYMATRYEGDNGEPDLEVVDHVNTGTNPEMGKLSTLLQWNAQDPPDDFERHRNDVIYYDYQHNRNPYIDHPGYIQKIWGGPSAIKNNPELQLSVYPNPVVDRLTVESGEAFDFSYKLFNSLGQVIATGNIKNGRNTLRFTGKKPGLYFLILFRQNGQWSQQYKILKTNARL
jgi:endonuclease I